MIVQCPKCQQYYEVSKNISPVCPVCNIDMNQKPKAAILNRVLYIMSQKPRLVKKIRTVLTILAVIIIGVVLLKLIKGDFRCSDDKFRGVKFSSDHKTLLKFPADYVGKYEIPAGIVNIGEKAFENSTGLTGITIPDSVRNIGKEAFAGCLKLNSLRIPKNAAAIGEGAFAGVLSLSVAQGNQVFRIDNAGALINADKAILLYFPGNYQGHYTIPEKVTAIGKRAFDGCTGLSSITIHDRVAVIGDNAFADCRNLLQYSLYAAGQWVKRSCADNPVSQKIFLKKIEDIRASNKSIGEKIKTLRMEFPQIFNSLIDKELRAAKQAGIVFSKDNKTILSVVNKKITAVKIPECVTVIADNAFSKCESLTSISIPDSVTYIGKEAFWWCHGLRSVTMTDSVEKIGDAAFKNCSDLKKIRLSEKLQYLPEDLFRGCKSLETVEIPRKIKSLKKGVFAFSGIKHVDLPPALRVIPRSLFSCSALESVVVPATVHTIDAWAFEGCLKLQKVTLPNSLKDINWGAFSGCNNLSSITLPASVEYISDRCFKGVKKVILSPGNNKFTVDKYGALIDLDGGEIVALSSDFSGVYTIPEGIVKIRSYAFAGCDNLESVTFPSTFKEIAPCGFAESGIKYINIPPVITAIPEKAFAECSKLEKVYLHENVRSLEKEAFYFCSNLTNMNLYHVPEIFKSAVEGTPYKSYHTLYYVGGELRQRKPWWR